MTTLKDLSRRLGLSVTQVSRALNDHSDVSEATKERVREVARQMSYRPNISARRLVTGSSGLVSLVLPEPPEEPEDRLFVQIVGGLSRAFSRRELQFVLHIADPAEDIVEVYRRLVIGGGVSGFVILRPETADRRIAFLQKSKTKFVVHGRADESSWHPGYDIDNRRILAVLCQHLLARGHKRIAFLNGPRHLSFAALRSASFRAEMESVEGTKGLEKNGDMTSSFGMLQTIALFTGKGPKPTGMIASNAWIARGIYDAAQVLGLKIPGDLSVVCHDDILPNTNTNRFDPPLTATVSPLRQSWEPLADLLADLLDGREATELHMLGEFDFVERESVSALP